MSTETINICIPVFNEERNLENLYKELSEYVSSVSKKLDINFEDKDSSIYYMRFILDLL